MMSLMSSSPDLIGTTEAARILGCSPRTIHRMVKAGTLTPTLIASGGSSGIFLFAPAELDRAKAAA